MLVKNYPMTQEGKEQLENKLTYLKNTKLKEINEEIKRYHSFCYFSDNASFDQILDEQAVLKKHISELEDQLIYAKVIETKKSDDTAIQLGDTVCFQELPKGPKEQYTIVGQTESDPSENKISFLSPISQALLNHEISDELAIKISDGEMEVRILAIK